MYVRNDTPVKNTFRVELVDDASGEKQIVNVYQPKLGLFRKFKNVSKEDNFQAVDDMVEILSEALSRNAEKVPVTVDFLLNNFDESDLSLLFNDYFGWIDDLKKK